MERESRIEARDDILLAEAIAPQVDIEAQDDWITRRFIMYCRGAHSITLNLGFEDHVRDFASNRKPYTEDIINEYINHSRRYRRVWYADWQRSVNLDEAKPCMPCFHGRGKFRCDGRGHICTSLWEVWYGSYLYNSGKDYPAVAVRSLKFPDRDTWLNFSILWKNWSSKLQVQMLAIGVSTLEAPSAYSRI
jgi:hypothetical protein